MLRSALILLAAILAGCSTNPVTGRDQIVAIPAVQAHASIGYALSSGAQKIASLPCDEVCRDEVRAAAFALQAARVGEGLQQAARRMAPDLFERIEYFEIGVQASLGVASGSSARGQIALGAGLARLEPSDDVTAFLIAREMAHVIARHDEEDSGARMFSSGVTTLIPGYNLIAKLIASVLGSGAMVRSWALQQRREADEIAIALLELTGRSAGRIAQSLASGIDPGQLGEDDWAVRYRESAERVVLLSQLSPRYAELGE